MVNTHNEMLEEIDWNFPHSGKSKDIYNIHPYPAKFIPEIPRTLINLYPPPKDTLIFDPFCGSGTTLLEAQRMGYESIGVDLNPIACLITSVKTSNLDTKGFEKATEKIISNAQSLTGKVELPTIPNLDHWFKKEIQTEVAKLLLGIRMIQNRNIQDALLLSLSSILVRVSNQDSDTRYAAVEKKLSGKSVYENFRSKW